MRARSRLMSARASGGTRRAGMPSRACSATRSGPCAAPTPMWSGCRWPRWWPICGGWVRCRASRMSSGADIAAALAEVRARIERAARRAGREPAAVRLVAVSKTRPPEDVRAALWAGQRVFGENYAQELRDKARALGGASPAPEWHFIGPLQKNKVKYVVGTAVLVHAIESAELAAEIDRRAAARGLTQDVLVEVNLAREPQKHGVAPEEVGALVAALRALGHVRCRGLMTMAPLAERAEASRPHFRALRILAAQLDLAELSMGMTQDLEVAVEEGATLVRVGSAIFGARE